MNKCGKVVKNPVKKFVESSWKNLVEKSAKNKFPHNKMVLHMSFTNKIHVFLHKKNSTFFPVKSKFYTLST